jgi:hypothetical protein
MFFLALAISPRLNIKLSEAEIGFGDSRISERGNDDERGFRITNT